LLLIYKIKEVFVLLLLFISLSCMTYKRINKIKRVFLIFFTIFIFLHNFKLIFPTRNWPFFLINTQKQGYFLLNNYKTKKIAKIAVFQANNCQKNCYFSCLFSQVGDYFNSIQTRSFSSFTTSLLNIFSSSKRLLKATKELSISMLFSLKYRFFYFKNYLLFMREKLVWLLEGSFPTREATLGKAFVFAELSGAPETIYHSFKVIGILHLIAASSANIHLILLFLRPFLAFFEFWRGQKLLSLLSLIIIYIYFSLINGHFILIDSSPSILRASLSCGLIILARSYFNLAVKRLNLLILVGVLCLFINPFYLQSLGFQLSFLATFVILFYWPYIQKKIAKSDFMLSLTVQFFLWPLLIFYFSNVNLIAIPANILISPLVESLTFIYFVFIASNTLNFSFLADFCSNLIYFVSNIFFKLLNFLEKMPAKSIDINQNKSLVIGSLILIQFLIIYLIWRDKNRYSRKNKYRVLAKWSNWSNKQ
jgi:ComEC/Rec2-related protein